MTTETLPGMAEMLRPMARSHPDTLSDPMPAAPGDGSGDGDGDGDRVRDMRGDEFDPRIHGTKPDGSPSLTSRGFFRRKRGASAAASGRLDVSGALAPSHDITGPDAAGATCAGLYIMIGGILLGEDFSPESGDEFSQLADAFAEYCRAKGIDDFPPGIALVMACSMYAAKRLPKPRVQSRIAGFFGWIKGRWSRARADIGANRVRKNDAGKEVSERRHWFWGSRSDTGPQRA